ncbi:MAG: FeoA family protein [Bacteroidia bacterium]
MLLNELKTGQRGIIEDVIHEDDALKLLEMGCLPGQEVVVKLAAPFGGPMAISVGEYTLSLRISEARKVMIKLIG